MASIDKRPNGTYRARYREYPGGPQKTKTFTKRKDADAWLTTTAASLLHGTYVDPAAGRTTLGAWAKLYVDRQPWRATTRRSAQTSINHALRVLGADRPLSSIRRGDVQALLAGLDLAPSTIHLVRQHLGTMLAAAAADGLIAKNPVTGAKVPTPVHREVVPPTLEQVAALHAAAPAWFQVAIVLGAGLGLRQAEASGLTADRVDWLGERTVKIDRQWGSQARAAGFAPPKSPASVRVIPAADVVLAEVGRHIEDPTGFVLHEGGEPVEHLRFGAGWKATTTGAGLEGMRFHDLRHHYASALISAGCSVKAVQRALGHSSATTTLDVYGHLFPGDEDRIRAAVQLVFGSTEDSLRTAPAAETL
jgi:integrase